MRRRTLPWSLDFLHKTFTLVLKYGGFVQKTQLEQVLELVQQRGLMTRQMVCEEGLPGEYLAKLARSGHLSQLAPGVYMDVDADPGEHLELAVVAMRVPKGIFFGLTALVFHALTTQLAHTVEVAIERRAWTPRLAWPTLEVVHLSGASLTEGIQTHVLHTGVTVRVYSVAKTVADLFKFRSRYGVEVAMEALKEGWREGRFTLEEPERCARACRVHQVMRPYMEMLS